MQNEVQITNRHRLNIIPATLNAKIGNWMEKAIFEALEVDILPISHPVL